MAAGEYVSVSSQSDVEQADLTRERKELANNGEYEIDELASIYVERGIEPALAKQVAQQLMTRNALAAHARDELGISDTMSARPIQAAMASAASFAIGAALPLITVLLVPESSLTPAVFGTSLVFLALLGVLAAWVGGAPIFKATIRVTFWGALAMGLTALIGSLLGTTP